MNVNFKIVNDCSDLCAYIINKVITFYNIDSKSEEIEKLINEITSDKKIEEIMQNMTSVSK